MLTLLIPGDQKVATRVLRRGQADSGSKRFEASEFFQQVRIRPGSSWYPTIVS